VLVGCGGNGQEQNVIQIGETKQDADADAKAEQDAVNANAPVAVIGDYLSGSGTSSANQKARNNADADAANKSDTDQDATVDQKLPDTSCGGGCGGKGQEQNLVETSKTKRTDMGTRRPSKSWSTWTSRTSCRSERRGRARHEPSSKR